jgi:hypothetical protein
MVQILKERQQQPKQIHQIRRKNMMYHQKKYLNY